MVLGEHDRLLRGREQVLEAVDDGPGVAPQALARRGHQALPLGRLRGQLRLQVAVRLGDEVLQVLEHRGGVLDPAGVAPAPAVAPLPPRLQVAAQVRQEGPALGGLLQGGRDAGRGALLQHRPHRRRGQGPPAQPPQRPAALDRVVLDALQQAVGVERAGWLALAEQVAVEVVEGADGGHHGEPHQHVDLVQALGQGDPLVEAIEEHGQARRW